MVQHIPNVNALNKINGIGFPSLSCVYKNSLKLKLQPLKSYTEVALKLD